MVRMRLIWVGEPDVVMPGAPPHLGRHFLQRGADQIGQFEILEEDVEDFVLRHGEFEIVFALAGIGRLLAAAARRRRCAAS